MNYKQKEDTALKNQAVTTRLDLSSADAARLSAALSDLERRVQATEDGVNGVTDSLRGELAKV